MADAELEEVSPQCNLLYCIYSKGNRSGELASHSYSSRAAVLVVVLAKMVDKKSRRGMSRVQAYIYLLLGLY